MHYHLRRAFFVCILVAIVLCAIAIPIVYLLMPGINSTDWAAETGICAAYAIIAAFAAYLPLERGRARILAMLGIVLAAAFFLYMPFLLLYVNTRAWASAPFTPSSYYWALQFWEHVAGSHALAMGACCLSALVLMPRLRSFARYVGPLTALSAFAAASISTYLIWRASYYRLPGLEEFAVISFFTVAVAGALTTFVLTKFLNMKSPEQLTEVTTTLRIHCPRCLTDQTLPVGESRCSVCKLRFKLEVEEPRCPGCGYFLRGLTRPVCPECGKPLTPDDLASTTASAAVS